VTLYRAMTAAGGTVSRQAVSAMSVVYSLTMMIILIIALRVVNPTQLVARVDAGRKE
jgi:putative spermidine/putrescine transport system permease protein